MLDADRGLRTEGGPGWEVISVIQRDSHGGLWETVRFGCVWGIGVYVWRESRWSMVTASASRAAPAINQMSYP